MCLYDDMSARLEPQVQKKVVVNTQSNKCHITYRNLNITRIKRAFDGIRPLFLIYLILSPVCAVPLPPLSPANHNTDHLYTARHSRRFIKDDSPQHYPEERFRENSHHQQPLQESFYSKGPHLLDSLRASAEAVPGAQQRQSFTESLKELLSPTYLSTPQVLTSVERGNLRNRVVFSPSKSSFVIKKSESSIGIYIASSLGPSKSSITTTTNFGSQESSSESQHRRLPKLLIARSSAPQVVTSYTSKFKPTATNPAPVAEIRSRSSSSLVQRAISTSSSLSSRQMDESDDSSSAGRERRATPDSPSSQSGKHWSSPCLNPNTDVDENATQQSLSAIIIYALETARSTVAQLKDAYAKDTFHGMSWDALIHDLFQGDSLKFLETATKVDLTADNLPKFTETLKYAKEMMERRAVGIEQVTLDQALYRSKFLGEFREVESTLLRVLCDLNHAIKQFGDPTEGIDSVPRDIMKEAARDIDSTYERNRRDTLILKEYDDGLEILMNLFNRYISQMPIDIK